MKLTDQQHLELLLVFGGTMPSDGVHLSSEVSTRWECIFHWTRTRWPGLLHCHSYAYVFTHWQGKNKAAHDMSVLTEIHRLLRDAQYESTRHSDREDEHELCESQS